MMDYWTNFAKFGTPNSQGLFVWPPYQTATDLNVVLAMPPAVQRGLYSSVCDFWDVHYQKYYFE